MTTNTGLTNAELIERLRTPFHDAYFAHAAMLDAATALEAQAKQIEALQAKLYELSKQEPVAYLYHDARTPKGAHPWLHPTLLLMAAERRPELRGETPLYAAPVAASQPVNTDLVDGEARACVDDHSYDDDA